MASSQTPGRIPGPARLVRTLLGRAVAGVAVVAVGAALTGCGAEESSPGADATTPPAATAPSDVPQAPACDEVWVEGQDLPKGYTGCLDADSALAEPTVVECSSGQRVVTHADEWWAVRGHRIGHAPQGLKESKEYRKVLRPCLA